MATDDVIDRLRAELGEWRRRAEVAEAIAAERLARVETAERALRAAEAALARPAAPASSRVGAAPGATGTPADQSDPAADQAGATEQKRPPSLLERWRRYTETID